ncbi:unnamed protein product, partial [Mesorhabditis spiculigera]
MNFMLPLDACLEETTASRRKAMKRLTCRKCEGHGVQAILKGHAPICPFNECRCETCSAVMSMRASALIRRFRHRRPDQSDALLQTIRSKNGNMRLRIVPKGECPEKNDIATTEVHYGNNRSGVRNVSISPPSSLDSSGTTSPATLPPSPSLEKPWDLQEYLHLLTSFPSLVQPSAFQPAFQAPAPVLQMPLYTPEMLLTLQRQLLLQQLGF